MCVCVCECMNRIGGKLYWPDRQKPRFNTRQSQRQSEKTTVTLRRVLEQTRAGKRCGSRYIGLLVGATTHKINILISRGAFKYTTEARTAFNRTQHACTRQ